MDPTAIAFTLLIGVMAVVLANTQAFASDAVRRERYLRAGVLRSTDAPDADATVAFIAREKRRERGALAGSALITLVSAVLLALVGAPSIQAIGGVVLCAAFFGRSVVIALLAAREATQATSGPRVSRGRVRGLSRWLPLTPWLATGLVQAGFLTAYLPASRALRPDLAGWVLVCAVVSGVATLGGWVLAWWLARRPQLAADAAELAWSDATRRRDLTALLLTGPFLAVGVTVSAFSYDGDGPLGEAVGSLPGLAFGYLGVLIVLVVVGSVTATRRGRQAEAQAVHV